MRREVDFEDMKRDRKRLRMNNPKLMNKSKRLINGNDMWLGNGQNIGGVHVGNGEIRCGGNK